PITSDFGQIRSEFCSNGDALPQRLIAQKNSQLLNYFIHVQPILYRSLEQRTNPAEHCASPGSVLDDSFRSLPSLLQMRWILRQPLKTCMAVCNHGGERLIDFMGNRGGKLSHGQDP